MQLTALFFLAETFAPAILAKKAKAIRHDMQDETVVVRTEFETGDRMSRILRKRLVLPFIMMFTHPATQAPSLYRAFLYGVMYLMLSTFPLVFEEAYDMSVGNASLNYLSLCLGFMVGLQISHPLMDGVCSSPFAFTFTSPSLLFSSSYIRFPHANAKIALRPHEILL